MPVTFDETLWRSLYFRPGGTVNFVKQPDVTYGRAYYEAINYEPFTTRRNWLTGYGLDNNASILVVGCAFGYLIEQLLEAGIEDVWGIDGSDWLFDPAQDSEWPTGVYNGLTVKQRVAHANIQDPGALAALQALPGVTGQARFGWIIDEDAAPAHSDAELPDFIAALEDRLQGNARGRIVHLVSLSQGGGQDSSQNWKTLPQWEAVAPSHRWVDRETG